MNFEGLCRQIEVVFLFIPLLGMFLERYCSIAAYFSSLTGTSFVKSDHGTYFPIVCVCAKYDVYVDYNLAAPPYRMSHCAVMRSSSSRFVTATAIPLGRF